MDGKWFKINDRMINPAHIVDIDLNAQWSGISSVEITLSATEAEWNGGGSLGAKVLTYTGPQAEVLRPFLDKMFPCEMRSIQLPAVLGTEDKVSLYQAGFTCVLENCKAVTDAQ